MRSPYRAAPRAEVVREITRERDLSGVGIVLWIASVARVAFAIATHETFGAIATLAFVAVVALPAVALKSLRR